MTDEQRAAVQAAIKAFSVKAAKWTPEQARAYLEKISPWMTSPEDHPSRVVEQEVGSVSQSKPMTTLAYPQAMLHGVPVRVLMKDYNYALVERVDGKTMDHYGLRTREWISRSALTTLIAGANP